MPVEGVEVNFLRCIEGQVDIDRPGGFSVGKDIGMNLARIVSQEFNVDFVVRVAEGRIRVGKEPGAACITTS